MAAYYNEIDEFAAQWLRNLITAGHIAPGDVDTRSIEDVHPDDIRTYKQCHFFAGIGVWSYALRAAHWPDDRAVWTGSCPCQPFSAAGKGAGFADERHLWPAFFWLIQRAKPRGVPVFGEQVASRDGLAWVDLVRADVEGQGDTFGVLDTCSAGFGAPHIRQRLHWMAYGGGARLEERQEQSARRERAAAQRGGDAGGLADAKRGDVRGEGSGTTQGAAGGMQGTEGQRQRFRLDAGTGGAALAERMAADGRGPVRGFWSAAEWIACRDGKWRPVEPGTFPLAHGAANRVGRLRGYGNAINAEQTRHFIEACMSLLP